LAIKAQAPESKNVVDKSPITIGAHPARPSTSISAAIDNECSIDAKFKPLSGMTEFAQDIPIVKDQSPAHLHRQLKTSTHRKIAGASLIPINARSVIRPPSIKEAISSWGSHPYINNSAIRNSVLISNTSTIRQTHNLDRA
jgi:hypothetical protein